MGDIVLHSENQLGKLNKDDLIGLLIKLERELLRYKAHFLDKREVAKRYSVNPVTINRWMEEGKLPFYKADPGKEKSRVLFPLSELVEYEQRGIIHVKEQN